MTSRRRVSLVVGALGALFAAQACKPESARRADNAAEEVTEARDDLRREVDEVGRTSDKLGASKAIVKEAGRLARAQAEFEQRRTHRIQVMRAQHEVIGTQTLLISTMAKSFPLTDAGRADVNEKLTTFQSRLDEAANIIQGLQNVDAERWLERSHEATEAMQRLEDARHDAWEALDDAPKAARNAT